jgi:hypothetical protein
MVRYRAEHVRAGRRQSEGGVEPPATS